MNIKKDKIVLGLAGMTLTSATAIVMTKMITNSSKRKKELDKFEEELVAKELQLQQRESNLKKKIEVSKKEAEEKEEQLIERELIASRLAGEGNEAIMAIVASIQKELREIKKTTEYTRQELRICNSLKEYEN